MASGKITAQFQLGTCHAGGSKSVLKMIIITISTKQIANESQKRFRILGISSQKLERSTSFFVAPQVMLYEKRWARSACER